MGEHVISSGSELLIAVAALSPGASLKLVAGNRHLTLKPRDLDAYRAERARRGNKLPRGLQRVDEIVALEPGAS